MKIQFSVNKKVWVQKGVNPPDCGSVQIEVDLTKLSQEERNFVAHHLYEGGNGVYIIKPMGDNFAPLQSNGDTEQDAVDSIQQGMAKQKAYKEKECRENREKILVLNGKIQDWLGNPFVKNNMETVHGTYEKKTVYGDFVYHHCQVLDNPAQTQGFDLFPPEEQQNMTHLYEQMVKHAEELNKQLRKERLENREAKEKELEAEATERYEKEQAAKQKIREVCLDILQKKNPELIEQFEEGLLQNKYIIKAVFAIAGMEDKYALQFSEPEGLELVKPSPDKWRKMKEILNSLKAIGFNTEVRSTYNEEGDYVHVEAEKDGYNFEVWVMV